MLLVKIFTYLFNRNYNFTIFLSIYKHDALIRNIKNKYKYKLYVKWI